MLYNIKIKVNALYYILEVVSYYSDYCITFFEKLQFQAGIITFASMQFFFLDWCVSQHQMTFRIFSVENITQNSAREKIGRQSREPDN